MHHLPPGWLEYAFFGGLGGLIAQLLHNNCIELMQLKNGKLYLGTFGGMIISMFAGIIGDNNPVNAFMWGAVGSGFIEKLIERKKKDLLSRELKDLTDGIICNDDKTEDK